METKVKEMTIEQKKELGNKIFDCLYDSGIKVSDMVDILLDVVAVINTESCDQKLSALVLCRMLMNKVDELTELTKNGILPDFLENNKWHLN